MDAYLGIDFGTSGVRAIALSAAAHILHEQSLTFGSAQASRDPLTWNALLFELLGTLPQDVRRRIKAIAINGTSSTVLLCDAQGQPLLPPMMYNDTGDVALLPQLEAIAPKHHCVRSISSSLIKLLTFQTQPAWANARYLLHQADWMATLLHGQFGISDYHNSLKLGYDPAIEAYPDWFHTPLLRSLRPLLPQVVAPGTAIATLLPEIATPLDLPLDCQICAGTTDSIAAFLASGATQPGEAVTSLGSTLALKLLSAKRIDQAEYGIYSHRFGALWLAGGASNAGGAVLAHFFTSEALRQLSQQIDPTQESLLHYYPLLKPGERFPIHQPDLPPQLEPRPANDAEFLQGILESLARIEAKGYALLVQLGAPPLQQVLTAGGGAQNEVWRQIRQRQLKVPVGVSPHTQAAYGTALLALRGVNYALA